jgi:hypothetical protein
MNKFCISIILGMSALCTHSQNVIKIRSGLNGLDLPFYSHQRSDGYSTVHSNEYYTSKAIPFPKPYIDFHALLEFERNQKFSIVTGYSNSGIGGGLYYEYYGNTDLAETPEIEKGVAGGASTYASLEIHKIPIYFTYRLYNNNKCICTETNKKKVFIQPDILGGMSLMFVPNKLERFTKYYSFNKNFSTQDGDNVRLSYYNEFLRKTGIGLLFGMNFRLRNQLHEFAALSIYYELGLRGLMIFGQEGLVNDTYKYLDSVSSNGSALSVRLTFPVFTYNFTKKKFYRD